MGRLTIRYCQECGNRILPEDFDRGAAVTVNNLSYCSDCKSAVPQEKLNETYAKKRGISPQPQTKVARHFRQDGGDSQEIAQSKNARLIWVAGAVALVGIVIAIVAIQPGSASRQKSTQPAKTPAESRPDVGAEAKPQPTREDREQSEQSSQTKFVAIRQRAELACTNGDFAAALNFWESVPEELKGPVWEKKIAEERKKIFEAKQRAQVRAQEPQLLLDKMAQNAEQLLRQGKYEEAVRVWEEVPAPLKTAEWSAKIEQEKKKCRALKYIAEGRAKETANALDEAISCYRRAIQICPEFHLPYIERARIYTKRKELQHAIDDYNYGIKWMPSDAPELHLVYYIRGGLLYNTFRSREAMQDFCKVLELKPDFEKTAQICQYFRDAMAQDPGDPSATKMREYLQKYGGR